MMSSSGLGSHGQNTEVVQNQAKNNVSAPIEAWMISVRSEKDDGVLKNAPEKFYVVIKSGQEGKTKLKKSGWDSSSKCWKLNLAIPLLRSSAMEVIFIELQRRCQICKKIVTTRTLTIEDVEQASDSSTQRADRKELKKTIYVSSGDGMNIKELVLIFEIEPSSVGAPLITDIHAASRWQQRVADNSETIISVLGVLAEGHLAAQIAVILMKTP
ncbi:hypothetical protein PM082_010123 [Marasmius tenuissimus]|nr:hypothetical protein PM082_010123 [Marasmius tenuissimus]